MQCQEGCTIWFLARDLFLGLQMAIFLVYPHRVGEGEGVRKRKGRDRERKKEREIENL